jgi:short-subunit dehydrogenase
MLVTRGLLEEALLSLARSASQLAGSAIVGRDAPAHVHAHEEAIPMQRTETRTSPQTILITGAASGFGKLVAFELARRGQRVIATAQIWPQVTELKNAARDAGLDLRVDKLDVTSAADRENALQTQIDVLVSNAGVMEAGPIAEQPLELLRAMFEVNFFGGVALAQGFARQFAERRSGKLVFVSSMGGLLTVPYGAGYCASKHALEAVAEGLKGELEPFGVQVATANPGIFGTGFNDRGADSMRWYDPSKHFTRPESLAGIAQLLANQLDPRSMADVIVDVVLADKPKFRNVHPPEAEAMIKHAQKEAWTAES